MAAAAPDPLEQLINALNHGVEGVTELAFPLNGDEASEEDVLRSLKAGAGRFKVKDEKHMWWLSPRVVFVSGDRGQATAAIDVVRVAHVKQGNSRLLVFVPRLPRGLVALRRSPFEDGTRVGAEECPIEPGTWVAAVARVAPATMLAAVRSRAGTVDLVMGDDITPGQVPRERQTVERKCPTNADQWRTNADAVGWIERQLPKFLPALLNAAEPGQTVDLWLGGKDKSDEVPGLALWPEQSPDPLAVELPATFPPLDAVRERARATVHRIQGGNGPRYVVHVSCVAHASCAGTYVTDWGRSWLTPLDAWFRVRTDEMGGDAVRSTLESTSYLRVLLRGMESASPTRWRGWPRRPRSTPSSSRAT